MPTIPKRKLPPLELTDESIGERIARLRKQQGLTQQQLGEKIGISFNIVSDYERGRLRLYDEMVARFALALGVSSDELLGLNEARQENTQVPSRRIAARIQRIQQLSESQQKTILRSLDMMLDSAQRPHD